jgi:hypothetical protein
MNDPVSSVPTDSNLEQQIAALQRQVFLLLVALNVIAATIVFYFCYESHIAGRDYDAGRGRAVAIIQEYQKNALSIQKFDQELGSFGSQNPGFQPVLKKYGWSPSASTAPTASAP